MLPGIYLQRCEKGRIKQNKKWALGTSGGSGLGWPWRSVPSWKQTLYLCITDGTVVKDLPSVQETWVWSLGQEDSLEKGRATHSSILAWRIPWSEEPGGLQGCKEWTQLSYQHSFPSSVSNCSLSCSCPNANCTFPISDRAAVCFWVISSGHPYGFNSELASKCWAPTLYAKLR